MVIYRDTGVFYLSITGTENFQYRPLLIPTAFTFVLYPLTIDIMYAWAVATKFVMSYCLKECMYCCLYINYALHCKVHTTAWFPRDLIIKPLS